MQIAEFEWIKRNRDKLSSEDHQTLEHWGVFDMIKTGQVHMPAMEFVKVLSVVDEIVARNMREVQ